MPHKKTRIERFRTMLAETALAVERYAALRPALLREIAEFATLPGGPWRIQYRRDLAKADPALPVRWVDVPTVMADGPRAGDRVILRRPENYAPFCDFCLLDSGGNYPKDDSPAQRKEAALALLLNKILDAVRSIVRGIVVIGEDAYIFAPTVDLSPLRALHDALPVFPFWPAIKGMTQADYDRIVEAERPLLRDALLVLRNLDSAAEEPYPALFERMGRVRPRQGGVRQPPDQAIAAYRAVEIMGKTQRSVAAEFGVSQGQVSRWISFVRRWLKAGNVLPDLGKTITKPRAMNPEILNMGPRVDGLTPRQRQQFEGDDE